MTQRNPTDETRQGALNLISAPSRPLPSDSALLRFVAAGGPFGEAVGRVIDVSHLGVDQVRQALLAVFASSPALHQCSRGQIMENVLALAELGLRLQWDARLIVSAPDHRGLRRCAARPTMDCIRRVAMRSPDVEDFSAQVVREDDHFEVRLGTEPRLDYRPTGRSTVIRGAWALVRRRGEPLIEVLTEPDVAEIQAGSQMPELWDENPRLMWRAAVIRRAAAGLGSAELMALLDLYHASFRVKPDPDLDLPAEASGTSQAIARGLLAR